MTIAFLSLFFGLITGPYPVELSVNGPVAEVEILLDGRTAARLDGPPWTTEIDFGRDLLPHTVVACALDDKGREIGRAQAWVNLPNPLTKVEILPEGDPGHAPRAARVIWTNLKGEQPRSVTLSFDGLPVTLDAAGRAALPPHDLKTLHVLSAEVEFSPLQIVRKDAAYGGEFGSEVSTELTALPVRSRQGKLPPPDKLGGWFKAGDQTLSVAAVEEGPAQLFVVRSPQPREIVNRLGTLVRRPSNPRTEKLDNEHLVRFVFPVPLRFESGRELTDLFDISTPFTTPRGGFAQLVETVDRRVQPGVTLGAEKRIADAVAVAGLTAVTENRRRAVLLVISGDEKDASFHSPAAVRKYLESIHVPLFVWCLNKPAPESPLAAWGECAEVLDSRILPRAIGDIRRELNSQRIVLVDGRHLPQSIALGPAASGQLELVGGGSR
ncbi:MAG TPA: hypothetical protein VF789_17490 [Thermoanaerobaculia bacterium]